MYEPRFTELFIQNTGVLIHLLYIKHLLITNTFLKILTTLVIKVRVKTDSSYNGASNNGQFFYTRVDFFKWDITGQFLLLFVLFKHKLYRNTIWLWDYSNLDRQSIRWARWPLDHHHHGASRNFTIVERLYVIGKQKYFAVLVPPLGSAM